MSIRGNAIATFRVTQRAGAFAYCLLGVLGFSLTLPATRIASGEIDPLILGPGRGALAAACAAAWLRMRREPLPTPRQLRALSVVALGTVIGFPLLTTLALRSAPAQHAVVVVGLSPLATSLFAALRHRERPSLGFWLWALAGTTAVTVFALTQHASPLVASDALLLLAVVLVGLGYAEGGRLASELDGFSVICWALVLSLPCTLASVVFALARSGIPSPGLPALAGFGYVSLVSMLLGFCAWYRGLALGGVARGSQVQLLQPVLSLVWCSVLLAEPLSRETLLAGAAVLTSALGSRLSR